MSGEVVLAYLCIHLAPVVRRMDKAIYQINRYPVHKCLKKTNYAIHWIVYLVHSVIQPSNNRDLVFNLFTTRLPIFSCSKWFFTMLLGCKALL